MKKPPSEKNFHTGAKVGFSIVAASGAGIGMGIVREIRS
jgi:hypothetical protein